MNEVHAKSHFASVRSGTGSLSLEFQWIARERTGVPTLVFLHEGLGSLALWRDWPQQVCDAGGFRGLVYSRPGYGQSTPRTTGEKWPVDFMHAHALQVLPLFLRAAGVNAATDPPWLVGHSDGGSIALIHAAGFPEFISGVIVLAPHVFVEDVSISSIEQARKTYLTTDWKVKLARYHSDPDSAFWGWNDIWLDPEFRSWNIEELLPKISKPVLAIQGEDDEYGTMAQVDSIAKHARNARLLKLAACGHSPHRDQPQQVTRAIIEFIARRGRFE